MKVLAFFMVFIGLIAFWSAGRKGMEREETAGGAAALNYALFRQSVFDYAFENKSPAELTPESAILSGRLPQGWLPLRPWRGLIRTEGDGRLYCYVYGPAQPEERAAIQELLLQSAAAGWNDGGFLIRNGQSRALPPVIPLGAAVSLIRID